MKRLSLIGLICILFSCNSKDEQFCKCMKAGEELDSFSSGLFTKEVNEDDASKLQELKKKQKKECAKYQTMTGPEMLKRKAECAE